MYVPAHFNEERVEVLHDLIRSTGLATLVSITADGLIASHAPLMLDPHPAPYGTLIGHLAKANPHARAADPVVQTLVIFQGPDGYITPSYYAAKQEHGKVGIDMELHGGARLRHAGGVRRSGSATGGGDPADAA